MKISMSCGSTNNPHGHIEYALYLNMEDPTRKDFAHLMSLVESIAEKARIVLGEDFVGINTETSEIVPILRIRKGTSSRQKENFRDFRGWVALFDEH